SGSFSFVLGSAAPTFLASVRRTTSASTPYTATEVVCIVLVAGSLSFVTIIGNILVMVSIKVNRQLQTVNNYFLFSLACADLFIGVFPMNLYTLYTRTPRMAGMMIAAAWVLPFILWAPAILFWQFIVGERTVAEEGCDIQFLSCPVTFSMAIAAFYLPITIMTVLYWQISQASKSRIKTDKKEGGQTQDPGSPSLVQGKIVKPNNNNNIPANDDGIGHTKIQNGKASGESVTRNCVTAEEMESSNDSTSVSLVASDVKGNEAIKGDSRASVSQANAKVEHSKLACIKVLATSPKADCIDTANTPVDIVGTEGKTGDEKHNVVARKIVKMTKQSANKETPPSREKKVTRTILAILLGYIITWTPYNVLVLIHSVCESCIPHTVWTISYWLCYVNSTINPACYALCNATFKRTFKQLLMRNCKNTGATR
uniref:G-protein coupled receptors family 1 profile domain-containing protein n=1 Tax=Varanus komodoensis TaxID=61221 RepID=A0A8D2J069_VARKO